MKKAFALILCVLLAVGIASIAYAMEDDTDAPDIAEPVSITEETASEEIAHEEATEPEATEPEAKEEITPEATETEVIPEDAVQEETAEDMVSEIPLSQLLSDNMDGGEITVDAAVIVDEDAELPEGTTLTIQDGALRIPEDVCLENNGCICIAGGELVVETGAALNNSGFIKVCENGVLTVSEDADYTAAETGVLALNVCGDNSEAAIEGVDTARYEITVPANTASELLAAVSSNIYAFKTVCISDFSVLAELGAFSMSENVAISFIG